ncbi:MAG: hypothetical protein K6F27_02120 [Ruminococcus sp.]|nr:hypothetical protein [Ruminococcus sp.]
MKQLTCEMCGSTDMMKQDGVFVCQTCGTKYSVEEAKKMMVEGTVNVAGTVKVDNSEQIGKYMAMAKSAYEANNLLEAEQYCNKIIEIDPDYADAWLLKGKAAGWQTTAKNNRISEAAKCFSNAVMLSSTEKVTMDLNVAGTTIKASTIPKEYNAQQAYNELVRLSVAIISLQSSYVIEYTGADDCRDLDNKYVECINAITDDFLDTTDADIDFSFFELANSLTECVIDIVIKAYNAVYKEYTNEQCASKYEWDKYRNRIANLNANFTENASTLLNIAINEDTKSGKLEQNPENAINMLNTLIRYHKALIDANNKLIDSCSWEWHYIDYDRDMPGGFNRVMNRIKANGWVADPNNDGYYCKDYSLTDKSKELYRQLNSSYNKQINCLEEMIKNYQDIIDKKLNAEKQERIDAYWKEHADEKSQLETELANLKTETDTLEKQLPPLSNQISSIRAKMKGSVPSEGEKETVRKEIAKLEDEYSKLGMFKGKEKKSIQAQIDELKSRISNLDKSIEDERKALQNDCNNQIRPIQAQYDEINSRLKEKKNRIAEIEEELTKDR